MATLLAVNALGTRVEAALDGRETPGLRAAGEAAIDEVRLWHDRLSLFLPRSFLSHMNREASNRPLRVDEDVWGLLSLCEEVHTRSGGAFDPTVAGLMRSAGLHPPESRSGNGGPVGWSALVELDAAARTVRYTRPGMRLDLGGVAKGFALDRAAEVLRAAGVEGAVLQAGTSGVVSIGNGTRTIAVRAGGGHFALEMHDGALCVSAPRGRLVEGATHIMDPVLATSAGGAETTVVLGRGADACARCDAWATALVVLGARPAGMDSDLASAIHDGSGWIEHGTRTRALSEAA